VRRQLAEEVAARAEVVVDHVEDDGEAEPVRSVDEAAQLVGPAVEPRRREEVDALVPPAVRSSERAGRRK
jgi:hypothetical protein